MLTNIIEFVFSISIFANGALFIPQILSILKTKDVKDLSLITFLGFNIIQISVMLHGFLNHDKILAYGMLFAFSTCGIVTFLIIFYKNKNKIQNNEQNRVQAI